MSFRLTRISIGGGWAALKLCHIQVFHNCFPKGMSWLTLFSIGGGWAALKLCHIQVFHNCFPKGMSWLTHFSVIGSLHKKNYLWRGEATPFPPPHDAGLSTKASILARQMCLLLSTVKHNGQKLATLAQHRESSAATWISCCSC